MRINTRVVIDMETGEEILRDSYEYTGPLALAIRAAEDQANAASVAASTNAAQYGATAAGIGANLIPFETRQMINPQGESQRDVAAQLTAARAGAGGATAGLTGAADKNGAVTRNPMGFSAALDAAARQKDKAAAGAGERVAANNAEVKLNQSKDAAGTLGGLYGTNVKAQSEQSGQIANDIKARMAATQDGWMQAIPRGVNDATDLMSLIPGGG
jgi:hypothetical protein